MFLIDLKIVIIFLFFIFMVFVWFFLLWMKYLMLFIEFFVKCYSVESSFSMGDGGEKVVDFIENIEENKDL